MDFKQAKLDWVDILQDWIIYTQTDRRKLAVNDDSRDIEGVHGRITSPLYARYRIITLEGLIDRLSWSEQDKINHLQNIFYLQSDLSSSLEERELYIKDNYNQEWNINVKIKEPIEFIEGDDDFIWSHWRWRVVLESTSSPVYKSFDELLINGNEWNFWGLTMWFELWEAWDEYDEIIEINTLKTQTYTRFELDAIWDIDSPLTIKNITNNTFFALDISAVSWDKIIIDSDKYTVTKNWENIIWNRIEGSIWQRISWDNQFIVTDKDWNVFNKDLSVKIYYRNALL